MSLREKLQGTATKLVSNYGDVIQLITVTTSQGDTDSSPPVVNKVYTDINAIVTGAGKWSDGEAILHSDLRVLVSGAFPVADVGDNMRINGKIYTVTMREDVLALGVKSAVIYFVRR